MADESEYPPLDIYAGMTPEEAQEFDDWPKRTFDFPWCESAEQWKAYLESHGTTVEEFKKTPAYKLPVKFGTAPEWFKDL